uniref:type-F conjugative transfer system pilin acetylase TraX n=1 Tax=Yersiniaceae TaxID=1903411 RepID=UPI001F4C2404|nr:MULTISPECIES: type-F conjugative transfer system pilin acetylase TraX [Yersiniaceae]ULG12071.1 type-F conjugative transfer system pilin acetylase TraX [Serratia entomophila]ULG15879.1 type-F conjugative transfer system pilin acetylase TraX [Serratia proteamaculans]ULG17097.1 type-F conjugative transfer system pilin acetylase TraX [Serratia proteamaculans]ULG18357.1 type-F conjugative transfer system pilin acetylase TraX [Serratia proteamaculans]ULG19670.1 type-F conjugative transfer system 
MNDHPSVTLSSARSLLNLSPLQRDVIRMVAFIAMVGDHVATAFQTDMPLLNLVGRCAFPLFALVSGCNLVSHRLRQSSLNRLWLMALLAQPGFWLAFQAVGMQWWQLNILFTFAAVMQVAVFLQNATLTTGLAAFAALVLYLPLSSASYGPAGLLMLAGALLVWQVREMLRPAMFAIWLLLVALVNACHGDAMMLSGIFLTLTVLFCVQGLVPPSRKRLRAGRWFAPAYAIHLAIIGVLISSH